MKKILFISYHFPPLGGAGVGRSLKFVKYLSELGWHPIVISAGENVMYGKDYSLLEEVPETAEVYRVGHREYGLREWRYICDKLRIGFDFPDVFKSWYSPAYQVAARILQREKVDLIFSSSAPYTSHFIAMRLKKEFMIPWVADFRDPWFGNDLLNTWYEETLISPVRKILAARIQKAERKIIDRADRITVVSWRQREELRELHGIRGDKAEVITNGYDEADFRGTESGEGLYPEKLTITFVGSFYPGFKELAKKFLDAINQVANGVEVVFIGKASREMEDARYSNVTCIHNIPKEKMLKFSASSDFLFLIVFPTAKWCIPGKIFEYLRISKPIIALVPENGDAASIIREADAGCVLSYDIEEMKVQLSQILEKHRKGFFKEFRPEQEYMRRFEWRKLTQELAHIFDDVSGKIDGRSFSS